MKQTVYVALRVLDPRAPQSVLLGVFAVEALGRQG